MGTVRVCSFFFGDEWKSAERFSIQPRFFSDGDIQAEFFGKGEIIFFVWAAGDLRDGLEIGPFVLGKRGILGWDISELR